MSKALVKIERLESNLNAGLFMLESGNGRMDDLRTMIGQIKVAVKKDRQDDYDRCIKRIEGELELPTKLSHNWIYGDLRDKVLEILKEELTNE